MLTLNSLLARNRALFAGAPAILDAGSTLTWSGFADRVERVAGGLHGLGIRRGDRFALIARNSPLVYELLQAGAWLGAVPVPVNHRLAPPEIAAILDHAQVRWVAVDEPALPLFSTPALTGWRDSLIGLDAGASTTARPYAQLVAGTAPMPSCDPAEDDVALLLYTGGTTGRSKGVPLTHRNIVANALQVCSAVHFDHGDVYLHAAPMFHSADLLATGVTLQGGAHSFLPQFTPDAFAATVRSSRSTRTMLAPAMVGALLDSPAVQAADLASLRQVFYGSSPMAPEMVVRAMERFAGVALAQGYGLTETSPLLTVLSMDDHVASVHEPARSKLHTAGRALPGVDILIADAQRHPAAPGQPGEVWVRGPNVVGGYHAPSGDDDAALKDGWFRTGDIGRLDDAGYLALLDRSKDMVITGGENVYSIEVEAVLLRHPAVKEAAVIGVPDPKFGEALLAVVACNAGASIDLDELVRHCRDHIGGYKIPRRLHLVDALPRSALGKVLKGVLRERLRDTAS